MNNSEITAIKEFRRFATSYLYTDTSYILMTQVQNKFKSDYIDFDKCPQQVIKFNDNFAKSCGANNNSIYMEQIHILLKEVFVQYFNNPEIISIIRNRSYLNIKDPDTKVLLYSALEQIQHGNPQYLGLLFNITILGDIIYLYL